MFSEGRSRPHLHLAEVLRVAVAGYFYNCLVYADSEAGDASVL